MSRKQLSKEEQLKLLEQAVMSPPGQVETKQSTLQGDTLRPDSPQSQTPVAADVAPSGSVPPSVEEQKRKEFEANYFQMLLKEHRDKITRPQSWALNW